MDIDKKEVLSRLNIDVTCVYRSPYMRPWESIEVYRSRVTGICNRHVPDSHYTDEFPANSNDYTL